MENVRRTIRLLALILTGMMITPAPTRGRDAAPAAKSDEPASPTRHASCLLKIVAERDLFPLNPEIINYLFRSSAVRDRAIQQVLGLTPEQAPDTELLTVTVVQEVEVADPVNEHRIVLLLEVSLRSQDFKPRAKELMAALTANFQRAVREACQSEVRRQNEQTEMTEHEVRQAEVELESIQHDLLGIPDLSSQNVRSRITAITSQLQALQLEKATKEAYREALLGRIAEIRSETEKSLRDDTIAVELQQIIQRREVELKKVQGMVESGRATPMELNAEQDKLATARIDLARRREELAKAGGAASLGQLTSELTTLTLDAAQAQAQEKQLEQQLQQAKQSLPRAAEYERMTLKLDVAKRNLQEALILRDKARQRARMFHPPSVSVIGG
ncbi:MAG: hypothetical protein JW955_02355 [Sedimentisphaerales bacterium]|nr:hypothetical protein [Sedimentisphaerales bacterium]